MPYEPDRAALERVAECVRAAVREAEKDPLFGSARLKEVPAGVIDTILNGQWAVEEDRNALESALLWKPGDIEWVARGGEPTRSTVRDQADHRKWRVVVTVERTVESPTNQEAIAQVCEPIHGALGGGEVGIVEVTATNLRTIERRREEQRPPGLG